jgi:hypothetical protein
MRRLFAVFAFLILAGGLAACGGETPATPTPTPIAVRPIPTVTPEPTGSPPLSTNEQIFATGTAERALRLTAGATLSTATRVPLSSATSPPAVPTATRRPAPAVSPTKPTARATAVPTGRSVAKAPTATAVPADCLTKAERAYVTEAQTVIDAMHSNEDLLLANFDTSIDGTSYNNPVKQQAYSRALDNLITWSTRGARLTAPPEWQAVQPFWNEAMKQFPMMRGDLFSPPIGFVNRFNDALVQYLDLLQPLVDARCS